MPEVLVRVLCRVMQTRTSREAGMTTAEYAVGTFAVPRLGIPR
ncbi:MAG: DUF4244 domain-containing protein [Dermatophilaceae bacterium]